MRPKLNFSPNAISKIQTGFIESMAAIMVMLFLYTAVQKGSNTGSFAQAMEMSPLIGGFSKFLSITVPIAELITVALLMLPVTRFHGLVCSSILMFTFTVYTGLALFLFPTELPCTCGGILRQLSWRQHLLFNTFLLFASTLATLIYPQRFVRNKQEQPNTCEHSRQHFTS